MTRNKKIWRAYKPHRPKNICGMSRSEFKRRLTQRGHKLKRHFWKFCDSICYNRLYRFHWEGTPSVDISCPIEEFDRWANSTDETLTIEQFIDRLTLERKRKDE